MRWQPLWRELNETLLPVLTRYRNDPALLGMRLKADRTFLTEADLEVQEVIASILRAADPGTRIIAEETGSGAEGSMLSSRHTWVIDPIDGTAQFVSPEGREFCSAVCRLENGWPTDAYVLMPELGRGRTPVVATASVGSSAIQLNGQTVRGRSAVQPCRSASLTRSRGSAERPFEAALEGRGYSLKTRTTSQTLDMLRTAVDLADWTDPADVGFDIFMRRDQWLWDGAPGMCFGSVSGLAMVNDSGEPLLPISEELLKSDAPVFASSIVGRPDAVAELLELL